MSASVISRVLVSSLLLMSLPIQAADKITILETIPYNDGVGTPEIRSECKWNTLLSSEIVKASKGDVVATKQALDSIVGPTLIIKIASVHAAGGGNFSGPKWALIQGELHVPGAENKQFELRRSSIGPFQFTSCKVLDKIARTLGNDVAVWLKQQKQ